MKIFDFVSKHIKINTIYTLKIHKKVNISFILLIVNFIKFDIINQEKKKNYCLGF